MNNVVNVGSLTVTRGTLITAATAAGFPLVIGSYRFEIVSGALSAQRYTLRTRAPQPWHCLPTDGVGAHSPAYSVNIASVPNLCGGGGVAAGTQGNCSGCTATRAGIFCQQVARHAAPLPLLTGRRQRRAGAGSLRKRNVPEWRAL
jgi:hypothetical protein